MQTLIRSVQENGVSCPFSYIVSLSERLSSSWVQNGPCGYNPMGFAEELALVL